MTLLAEDVDDVGEIGLGGPGDDIRRGRTVMSHPHVERAVEAERKTAAGLIDLHRGHPDIHHHAVDGAYALRGANLGEIGEAVLDQGQPAIRSVDEVKTSGDGGAVAIDADHARIGRIENGPAVAARAEGGIDIDPAVAGAEHCDGLGAEHGDMSGGGRSHCCAPA